jgi:hypothetical protein
VKRNRTSKGTGTGGLKRKNIDEDLEAEKIRQLEERMRLFKKTPNGSTAASYVVFFDTLAAPGCVLCTSLDPVSQVMQTACIPSSTLSFRRLSVARRGNDVYKSVSPVCSFIRNSFALSLELTFLTKMGC